MSAEELRRRHQRDRVEQLLPTHDIKSLTAERSQILNRLAQLKGNFSKEATQERARLTARQCAIWEILEEGV